MCNNKSKNVKNNKIMYVKMSIISMETFGTHKRQVCLSVMEFCHRGEYTS